MSSTSPPLSSANRQLLVTVAQAQKRYGTRVVLTVQALDLYREDVVVITGQNGSGKSTLLRVLSGITPVTLGSVVKSQEFETFRIAYVPQAGGLYQNLTLMQNFLLWGRLFSEPVTEEMLDSWYIRSLGLHRFIHTRVGELSGGFKKLAVIACALNTKPHCLFLDEPFSGVDVERARLLTKGLQQMGERMAFVAITSQKVDDVPFATRALQLNEGRLL